jgi:molecular chaperone DnaJ
MPTREHAKGVDRSAPGDLYTVLGVARDASPEEIKRTYRKLARKFHPDVNPGDKAAEERFKQISRANDVLSDEKTRKLYDEFGDDALQPGFDAERAREFRRWQGAAGAFRRGRTTRSRAGEPFTGGFEDLFGGIFSRGPVPERGADVEVPVTIDFLEAVRGTSRTMAVRKPDRCTVCGGSGQNAQGRPCPRCGGAGEVEEVSRLNVKIPAGVDRGSRVRLAGKGGAGSAGAPAGDLYIVVDVRPHSALEREGNDLTLDVPVTVGEAALGARINVPTPDGEVSLRIPAGTQSGSRLRLRGRGVPALHGRGRGDLYVRVMVHVPAVSEKTREAIAELERGYPGDLRQELKL